LLFVNYPGSDSVIFDVDDEIHVTPVSRLKCLTMAADVWCAVLVLLIIIMLLVEDVFGLGSGAKLPAATNFYKEKGMNAFSTMRLRYSMTVSVINTREQTYWGTRWNDITEAYELHGDFPDRSPETLFDLLDAGTTSACKTRSLVHRTCTTRTQTSSTCASTRR